MFLENSSKRPVIVLSGVKVSDLRSIMQFIYTGEVNVTEEDLPDLLEVAEMLGVRGLKSGSNNDETEDEAVDNQDDEDSKNSSVMSGSSSVHATTEEVTEESDDIVPNISITQVTSLAESADIVVPEISVKKDLTINEDIVADDIAEEEKPEEDNRQSFTTPVSFPAASFMTPSPLVSMSNLAAMYHHQQVTSPSKQTKQSHATRHCAQSHVTGEMKSLEWYRQCSQEGKVSLDLLPEDINAIMSQTTTPYCPLCNKDCANFPNLRSHLQVRVSSQPIPNKFPPHLCLKTRIPLLSSV